MKQSIKYIYNEKGVKYGVVVGLRVSDNTFPIVGVARCNMKEDNFSKKKAVALAKARAMKWGYVICSNPTDWIPSVPLDKYLEGFTNMNEESKFMDAITFVLKQLTPKE